ncbi:RluA family pseudouridine synthase [Phocaeicola sartorii]|uniref:RluA family pseudouridine synthase n=1 Tax=Phocaeicola sartorii TaxID=671267 RepID=UPI00258B5449|nr:RluA family pseudouridine synthase [Phocaeicola sartorii]
MKTDHIYETDQPLPDGITTAPGEEPEEEETSVYEHHRLTADSGQKPMRIDKFLMEHLYNTSRNRLQRAAEQQFILVNGKPVKSSYKVKPSDEIIILLDRPKYDNDIIPEDIPLDIVYEDQDLMVVNKPAGLVVHPGCGNYSGTLVNAIAWHLKDNPDYDPNDPTVGLVHRIDKDTSGLLVIAKNANAKTHLGRQFFNKTTHRLYNALVWGSFQEEAGRIEGNIARHPKDRMQMAVFPPDSDTGKHAVTHYRVSESFGYVTFVECRLETGRTHQIRAHMKHIGHPLFNDERYGGNEILRGTQSSKYKQFIRNCFDCCPRQALHARTLGFVHPRTGKEMNFSSDIPADMTELLERWRHYTAGREHEFQ